MRLAVTTKKQPLKISILSKPIASSIRSILRFVLNDSHRRGLRGKHIRSEWHLRKFVQRIIRKARQSFRDRGIIPTLGRCVAAPFLVLREYKRVRLEFDWKYGVDTEGSILLSKLNIESPNRVHGANYGATPPDIFWQALTRLDVNHRDFIFVDLGSGKGRAVLLASEFPFKEIIGVEFSPELNSIAQENVRRYKSKSQKCSCIKLLCTDFIDFHIPEEPVLFFLYYPCKEPIMRLLVQHIKTSVITCPRSIYIVYVNPQLSHMIEDANFVTIILKTETVALYSNTVA